MTVIWLCTSMPPMSVHLPYTELRRIASICQYLSCDATKTLISAFVFFSKLDYCNSLLADAPKNLIDKLQRVQNAAARLAVPYRRQHHITLVLYSLQWLPVSCRIQYKVSSLYHCSLFWRWPQVLLNYCINNYCQNYCINTHSLVSIAYLLTASRFVCQSQTERLSEKRSFSFTDLTVWNSLMFDIRSIKSIASFRQTLRTHLFKSYFISS